ncbi:hypothetical protein [Aurantimonas marina]|nr:hypothetical protein [Aurantimonas marina]
MSGTRAREDISLSSLPPQEGNTVVMNSIIYLVGLIVVVLVILSLLGLA